jgi:hypothetical protein
VYPFLELCDQSTTLMQIRSEAVKSKSNVQGSAADEESQLTGESRACRRTRRHRRMASLPLDIYISVRKEMCLIYVLGNIM